MPISPVRDIFKVKEIIPIKRNGDSIPNLYGVNLAFNGHNSQYSLHALHPYVAAINPPLVKKLIETYVPKQENILDPFCGGGGVLLECALNHRQNAGGDVNPLSIILSKAKTTYVDRSKLYKAFVEIIEFAENTNEKNIVNIHPQLAFWFKEESLPSINALIKGITEITAHDNKLNTLFKAIFSATVRDVMLTYRGEVRLRKLKGSDYEKFNPDVLRSFAKRYKIAYERIITLPINSVSNVAIGDVKKMDYENDFFHSIICSPPYADDKNGIGYFQFSKNMLEWLGYTKEEISSYKKMFLGASKEINELPKSESLKTSLGNVKQRNSTHYKEAVSFYYDYNLGLEEMARVVRKNIIIVIGNRVLSRTQFNNAQITVDFFNNIGIKLKHHYTRELRKKRIANLGADGGGIAKEHILVFER